MLDRSDQRLATLAAPQHDGGDGDHDQREEAPIDAGIEEQRVDAEVVVVLVGGHDLWVEEQRLARVLHEADTGEDDGQPDSHRQAAQQQLTGPVDLAQQPEQQAERQVEEGDVLGCTGVVAGVGGLHDVEPDGAEQDPFEPAWRDPERERCGRGLLVGGSLLLRAAPQACQQVLERAGGHDQIERDQQVDRAPVG
jgi:hypothetical protein